MIAEHERQRDETLKKAKEKGKGLSWQRIVMPGEGVLLDGGDDRGRPEKKNDLTKKKPARKIYTNDSVAGQSPTGQAPKGDAPPFNPPSKSKANGPIPKSNSF